MRPTMKRTMPVVAATAIMTFKIAACEDIFHSLLEDHFIWKNKNNMTNVIEGMKISIN